MAHEATAHEEVMVHAVAGLVAALAEGHSKPHEPYEPHRPYEPYLKNEKFTLPYERCSTKRG